MLRIAAYYHIHRASGTPTGVGKHIQRMTEALARRPDVALSLVIPNVPHRRQHLARGPLPTRDVTLLRTPRAFLERAWPLVSMPKAERLFPGADWYYSPSEVYLPTRRTPVAVTSHCINWFEEDQPITPGLRRARRRLRMSWTPMFRESERILAVSHFLKQRLVALFGVEPDRIAVVGNGIEAEYFQPDFRSSAGAEARRDRPYVLVVGSFSEWKNADAVLAVARALGGRQEPLDVVIAGRRARPWDTIGDSMANVVQLGYRGTENGLVELMRGATCLLNLARRETFGIPVLEAMACGTPAVVSHHEALPEAAGDAALVVDPADTEQVIGAIDRVRYDTTLRQTLIERGYQRAQQFTWDACAARVIDAMTRAERK